MRQSIFFCNAALTLLALFATSARAAIILESATYGGSESGGTEIGSGQTLGARFVLTTTVTVDHIGGNIEDESFVAGGTGMFGAIVKLENDPSALPASDWFSNGSVQAVTVFDASSPSTDLLVPLSVVLVPGEYALMFGSDHFGANGSGAMPANNTDTAQASYFFGTSNGIADSFLDGGFNSDRFVVTGEPTPEPSSLALAALGFIGLAAWRLRRR